MDQLTGITAAIFNALRISTSGSSLLQCILGGIVLLAVFRIEAPRHTSNRPQQGAGTNFKKNIQLYAPEIMGMCGLLTLSLYLRVCGSNGFMVDEQTFESIALQWPILLTADSLLALQAMLRLVVFMSTVLRSASGPTLLSQEAAAISCGAALGRATLMARSAAYFLDGPLGGYWPAACELLSVVFLAKLCRGIRQRALTASVITLAAAALIGCRNRLSLAGDPLADGLFIFAHTAELFAAFAYLSRALFSDVGLGGPCRKSVVALRFAHAVMPLQQCFAAYYFVQAFEKVPGLVDVGHPFEILQMGGVAQVAAFVGAAVLHWAECLESPTEESGTHAEELEPVRNTDAFQGDYPMSARCGLHQTAAPVPRHAAIRGAF
jgi:hypothetical protein